MDKALEIVKDNDSMFRYKKTLEDIELKFSNDLQFKESIEKAILDDFSDSVDVVEGFRKDSLPFNLDDAVKVQRHIILMQRMLDIDNDQMGEILSNLASNI